MFIRNFLEVKIKNRVSWRKTLSFSLAKLIVFIKRVKENLIKRTTAKKFATKVSMVLGLGRIQENGMHYKRLFKRGDIM